MGIETHPAKPFFLGYAYQSSLRVVPPKLFCIHTIMNTTQIRTKFELIGAEFVCEELPEPRYRAPVIDPYVFKTEMNRRRKPVFVLRVLANVREQLQVEVHAVDKRAKAWLYMQ